MSAVTAMTSNQSDITIAEASEFIWLEADILDRADYAAWLKLWTKSGLYIIPVNPESDDFVNQLNLVYDDAEMREQRTKRLKGGFAISAAPAAVTVRLNSRFRVMNRGDGVLTIRSAMHLTENKFDRVRSFSATIDHRLVRTDDGIMIDGKVVRLINSNGVLTTISYLF